MNQEGQRPPSGPDDGGAREAPEPGNARAPQQAQAPQGEPNGNHVGYVPQQNNAQGQGGGGRRRFRRQRRGGRGRGRGKGTGQNANTPPPLDAQGRIVDVENDLGDDGDDGAQDVDGNVQQPPA